MSGLSYLLGKPVPVTERRSEVAISVNKFNSKRGGSAFYFFLTAQNIPLGNLNYMKCAFELRQDRDANGFTIALIVLIVIYYFFGSVQRLP